VFDSVDIIYTEVLQAFYRGQSHVKLQVLASCCPALESLFVGSDPPRRVHFHVSF